MKKICVFSDSHGNSENMVRAVLAESPDLVIHLGDGENDLYRLEMTFPSLPIENVCGNCDWRSAAPACLRTTAFGIRIFAVHGHMHDVRKDPGLRKLLAAAEQDEARIVLFGHTHEPVIRREKGMEIMNPGSVGEEAAPTYGVIRIRDGEVSMELRRI